MSQTIARRPASKSARRSCPCTEAHALDCAEREDQGKHMLAAARKFDPVAMAQVRGVFDSLKALGFLPRGTSLEEWVMDRLYEAALLIHDQTFGGIWGQRTIQSAPDEMEAGGRVRSFHMSA